MRYCFNETRDAIPFFGQNTSVWDDNILIYLWQWVNKLIYLACFEKPSYLKGFNVSSMFSLEH